MKHHSQWPRVSRHPSNTFFHRHKVKMALAVSVHNHYKRMVASRRLTTRLAIRDSTL